jgi:hypothetical protein
VSRISCQREMDDPIGGPEARFGGRRAAQFPMPGSKSGVPPIATGLMRHSKASLGANSGREQMQQTKRVYSITSSVTRAACSERRCDRARCGG